MKTETVFKSPFKDSPSLAFFSGKKILITGANAYLGPKLAEILSGEECTLVLHGHSKPQLSFPNSRAKIILKGGDLSKPDAWETLIAGVDIVFHLAAHESKEFEPELDLEVNAFSTLRLLELCRRQNLRSKIVFASSANLVGLAKRMPVDETFQDDPQTIYAVHKLTSERYFSYYARQYGILSAVLRLSNVYGPALSLPSARRVAFNRMIEAAAEKGQMKLLKNRHCIRDYLFIDDAVSAFIAAASSDKTDGGRYYIVGNDKGYSLEEFAKLIVLKVREKSGKEVTVSFDDITELATAEFRNFVADSSRFRDLTGWHSKVSLEKGIENTLDFFLKA
ncbi:MAG: NAD(P)-dependent oxidoreductase [bacterium]|nr:NAD(P)-dependent oxidoreductase [bacterium]